MGGKRWRKREVKEMSDKTKKIVSVNKRQQIFPGPSFDFVAG